MLQGSLMDSYANNCLNRRQDSRIRTRSTRCHTQIHSPSIHHTRSHSRNSRWDSPTRSRNTR